MPVKSDIVLPKGAVLIDETPKQDTGIVLPKGAVLIDDSKKKEIGGVGSSQTSPSPSVSTSPSDTQKTLIPIHDWSSVENSFKNFKERVGVLNDSKDYPYKQSASPGGFVMADPNTSAQYQKEAQSKYDQSVKQKDELLKIHKEELQEPINTLIKSGHYKDFFDPFGNYKSADAIKYFDQVVKNNKGGNYVRDMLVANLKQAGEYEFFDAERQKLRADEYKKSGVNVDKYAPELLNRLTSKQRNNADLLEKESTEKANELISTLKPKAVEIGKQYTEASNNISNQYKQGQLSQEDANKQLSDLYNKYKSDVSNLDKQYQSTVRTENIKLQDKYARINEEIQGIEKSITEKTIWESIPEEDRKKIIAANNNAELQLQKRHNEIKKGLDELSVSGAGRVSPFGLMEKSFRSGWHGGLANIGNYLSNKGYDNSFTKYLQGKQYEADINASAQYEWDQDPLKRAASGTGQSLGASAPILIPSVAITIGTAGLGLPEAVGMAAAGLTSYYGEKAQNTGEVYQQTLQKTGDPSKAIEGADRFERKQSVMLPLYFLEGAGLQNLLKGGLKKSIVGTGQEFAQELPTEYWQNYTQAQETEGYGGTFGSYIKEHPETTLDVIAATLGQSGVMSAGTKIFNQINSLVPQSKAQYYADIISKHGIDFALENLQQQFNTGIIDEKQFELEQGKIMLSAKKLDDYNGIGLKGEDAKVYFILSEKANKLKKAIDETTDEGLKIGYEKELTETQAQLQEVTKGNAAYAIVTLPGGGNQTKVIPIQDLNKLNQEGKLDELIKLSENIEVKGNDEVNTLIKQRKSELGNPVAPEGLYENGKKEAALDEKSILLQQANDAALTEMNQDYAEVFIKDVEGGLKEAAQQLNATESEAKTARELYGPTISKIALELFPDEKPPIMPDIMEAELEKDDIISVNEMMDKKGIYKGQRGTFIQDGQSVVFKVDNSNREYELGNVNEIGDQSISDYGIETEESVVNIGEDGNINVRDKQYINPNENPLKAITKDEDGNVVSVNLKTPEGERRTFRGQVAEDIAYNITLQQIDKNNERSELEQFINDDESTRKEMDDAGLSEVTEATTTEDNGAVQREKIEPKTIKGDRKEKEQDSQQTQSKGSVDTKVSSKDEEVEGAKIEESEKKESKEKDKQPPKPPKEPPTETESDGEDNIEDYEMTTSGEVNKFLSGDTWEDVFGEQAEGDQNYLTQKLSDMLQDGKNMISIAQKKWGGDVMMYAKPLFQLIQQMANQKIQTNKIAVLLATFLGELQEAKMRSPERFDAISQLEKAVFAYYQNYMNVRGKEIVAGRLLRLYRDKFIGDIYADRILEKDQVKAKKAIQEVEQKKEVDDKTASEETKPITEEEKKKEDKAAKQKSEKAKKDQSKKKKISTQEAKQKADNKVKEIEEKLGKDGRGGLIDRIKDAIKKLNCK